MKINLNDYNSIFFTSDLHIGHDKEFLYGPRGCSSRKEHIEFLINQINSQAGYDDLIIHCGDMCLTATEEEYHYWLTQIKCKNIWSIVGNHDNRFTKLIKNISRSDEFQWEGLSKSELFLKTNKDIRSLGHQLEITVIEPSCVVGKKAHRRSITLNHYPMQLWNKSHHGSWHLCGHSHGSFEETSIDYPYYKRFDCGVENGLEYREIGEGFMFHWEDVKAIMSKKSIFVGDHHNRSTT